MPILNRIAETADEIAGWRRELHAHPELLYEVHRTAGFVADRLRAFGCDEVATGIGRTGVVGVIHGRGGPGGRMIGLRADMDALPIEEATGLPHRSLNPGVMHACGHDGHTAMLLGAARQLAGSRNFEGTAVVIFQPAEEGGAGAKAMLDDGLLDRFGLDEVYGMHNYPGLPVGRFALRSGPVMASADRLQIEIEGQGAHAAAPHTGVDPILVGSHIVTALQSVVARNVDPLQAAVVSVTTFHGGSTDNVIPQTAVLRGTMRSLDAGVREALRERIRAIAGQIAAAFGARAAVTIFPGYPVTINHAEGADQMVRAAADVAGAGAVSTDFPPIMAAEDFSYMLERRPGAMIFLGNGDSASLHHPGYDFDDRAIPYGASLWVRLVEMRLAG